MKNSKSNRNAEKKVLAMVLKGYPRISETFIANEIRLLEEMGFTIHIFSMREPRETFRHAWMDSIRAKVTYLPENLLPGFPALAWNTALVAIRHPRRFGTCLRTMFRRFSSAPKKHTWLKHLMQAAYLVRHGRNLAHVHAHFAHTPATVGMYAAILADLPYSFTAHAKDIYTQKPERYLDKMDMAKFVVTCTKYNRRHLLAACGSSKPVHCVYHGIDLKLFSAEQKGPHTAAPYRVVTVARFVPKKGLDTIIRAVKMLRDAGMDVRHTIIGDGELRRSVSDLVSELDMEDVVTLTGTIAHEQVLGFLRKADVFALGCRQAENGDRDGIPNVIAEAMAMGVPVAATNVSGVPELIKHEQTGMLCEPDSIPAMADNIRRLLTEPKIRNHVMNNAHALVHDVFDNVTLTRKLGEIYLKNDVPCELAN